MGLGLGLDSVPMQLVWYNVLNIGVSLSEPQGVIMSTSLACVRTGLPVGEACLRTSKVICISVTENECSLGSDGWLRTSSYTEAALYRVSDLLAMVSGTREQEVEQEWLTVGRMSERTET